MYVATVALSSLSAFATNILILLHICWGVLWFDGWEQRGLRRWIQIGTTFFSHMLVAGLVSLKSYWSRRLGWMRYKMTFKASVCVRALVACLLL